MSDILRSFYGRLAGLDVDGDFVLQGRKQSHIANLPGTASGTGVVATEYCTGLVNKTVLTCTATPITVADDPGVSQYGGAGKIYDFPEGLIWTMGAIVSGTILMGATGTFINTWSGVIALGTAAASTGSTLVSTEATWLQSVAIGAATAKLGTIDAVSVATALTEAGSRWVDGTATAADMFLNLAIADDASHTAGTGVFNGTVKFLWTCLGDN
jgi:hypothetical protein